MKILLLSPQPFFTERGTPINVRQMLYALSSAGHEVTLLCYPLGNLIEIEGVEIKKSLAVPFINSIKPGPSLKKIVLDFFFFFSALKLFLTKEYDTYHGIEEAGFIAGLFSMFSKKPFVFDVDSSMSSQLEESGFIKINFLIRVFKSLESYFFRKASSVLTVCSALSEEVLKICPDANIVQIEDFPIEVKEENFSLVENYKVAKKIILYAGNFEAYQGVELLIESYAKSNIKELASLVLVGRVNSKVKKLVKKLNIENNVVFTGQLESKYMPSIHREADLLVSPRLKGVNTPLKIYTYMNSERLILATNIKSHTQVLSQDSAILVEPSQEDFSKGINLAFSEKLENKIRIEKAKHLVDTKYSVERFNKQVISLYG